MVDNTPDGARGVRRMFDLHLLPNAGGTRVSDVMPGDIRGAVRTLVDAGKISTGISLHMYTNAMPVWVGRRKPWRLLFEGNPVEGVCSHASQPPHRMTPATELRERSG